MNKKMITDITKFGLEMILWGTTILILSHLIGNPWSVQTIELLVVGAIIPRALMVTGEELWRSARQAIEEHK